jgi:hypothetical protein
MSELVAADTLLRQCMYRHDRRRCRQQWSLRLPRTGCRSRPKHSDGDHSGASHSAGWHCLPVWRVCDRSNGTRPAGIREYPLAADGCRHRPGMVLLRHHRRRAQCPCALGQHGFRRLSTLVQGDCAGRLLAQQLRPSRTATGLLARHRRPGRSLSQPVDRLWRHHRQSHSLICRLGCFWRSRSPRREWWPTGAGSAADTPCGR